MGYSILLASNMGNLLYCTCLLFQMPDFGDPRTDPHAKAMHSRIQFFRCSSMPVIRRGMETVYRARAMHIIHWMLKMVEGMDLFENKYNGTPKFIMCSRPSASMSSAPPAPTFIDLTTEDYEVLANVTECILPQAAIECAHLDVYDSTGADHEVIPYRLTSRAWDVSSEAYHR